MAACESGGVWRPPARERKVTWEDEMSQCGISPTAPFKCRKASTAKPSQFTRPAAFQLHTRQRAATNSCHAGVWLTGFRLWEKGCQGHVHHPSLGQGTALPILTQSWKIPKMSLTRSPSILGKGQGAYSKTCCKYSCHSEVGGESETGPAVS